MHRSTLLLHRVRQNIQRQFSVLFDSFYSIIFFSFPLFSSPLFLFSVFLLFFSVPSLLFSSLRALMSMCVCAEDDYLIYLDPHTVQDTVNVSASAASTAVQTHTPTPLTFSLLTELSLRRVTFGLLSIDSQLPISIPLWQLGISSIPRTISLSLRKNIKEM